MRRETHRLDLRVVEVRPTSHRRIPAAAGKEAGQGGSRHERGELEAMPNQDCSALITSPSFPGSERVCADNLTAGPGRESLVDRQISGVGVSTVRLASTQGEGVGDTHNRGVIPEVVALGPGTHELTVFLTQPDRPVRERVVGPAGAIARLRDDRQVGPRGGVDFLIAARIGVSSPRNVRGVQGGADRVGARRRSTSASSACLPRPACRNVFTHIIVLLVPSVMSLIPFEPP